jgi:probable addiction module antidote protein
MPRKSANYDEFLYQKLREEPEFAKEYLNAALEEDDMTVFYIALRQVMEATQGISKVAKATGRNRESLYKAFSEKGNPEFTSVKEVIDSLGLKLAVS